MPTRCRLPTPTTARWCCGPGADQVVRRPHRPRRRRPGAARRAGARPGGGERRGQVDPDEAARRRLPARRGHDRGRTGSTVTSVTRCRPSTPASRRSSRSSTCCRSARSPRTSTSAASPAAAAPSTPGGCSATPRSCSTGLGVTGIRAGQRVRTLSVAEQQIVEIAKAISFDARVIQMDEPTAALADHEVELLYGIIRGLAERGVAILYVSHRLKEVFDLCDTITVLKDGQQVATEPAADLDDAALVRLMVGRSISSFFPDPVEGTEVGEPGLELRGAGNGYVDGVDLTLRAGEIVGRRRAAGVRPHRAARGDLRRPPVHPRRDGVAGTGRPARVPAAGRAQRARDGDRGPQGHRPGPQPVHPRQRARRRPRRLPAPYSARAPRDAGTAVLAGGVGPGPRPGGAVPLRRQPAEGRARPLAGHPARRWC